MWQSQFIKFIKNSLVCPKILHLFTHLAVSELHWATWKVDRMVDFFGWKTGGSKSIQNCKNYNLNCVSAANLNNKLCFSVFSVFFVCFCSPCLLLIWVCVCPSWEQFSDTCLFFDMAPFFTPGNSCLHRATPRYFLWRNQTSPSKFVRNKGKTKLE